MHVNFSITKTYMKQPLDHNFDDILLVYQGRKEIVVECDDQILMRKLRTLAEKQDTFFPQIKPLVTFLDLEGISYTIAKEPTTTI